MREPTRPIRVIVDTRNGGKDRLVPAEDVRRMYKDGTLHFDETNSQYCVPESGVVPPELMQYPMMDQASSVGLIKQVKMVQGTIVRLKKPRRL